MFEISEEIKNKMIRIALDITKHSYCPYSKYPVGAALLLENDEIITGGWFFLNMAAKFLFENKGDGGKVRVIVSFENFPNSDSGLFISLKKIQK